MVRFDPLWPLSTIHRALRPSGLSKRVTSSQSRFSAPATGITRLVATASGLKRRA